MTRYGKITSYDAERGVGTIAPEQGGDALPFRKSDLQEQAQEPRSDQLYTFETQEGAIGQPQAINLQMEQSVSASQQAPGAHGNQGGFDQQGQSQSRHNQDAASRSGVDQAGDNLHRMNQSQNQSQNQTRNDQDGVSRGGAEQARGDSGAHEGEGGSTFQPLESSESKARRTPEQQRNLGRDLQGRDKHGA